MKFSNSLKFNAIAEWWEDYIAYSALKKKIYELATQFPGGRQQESDHEGTALLGGDAQRQTGPDGVFIPLLDRELKKISDFYVSQVKEYLDELEELAQLVDIKEEEGPFPLHNLGSEDEDSDDDEIRSSVDALARSVPDARSPGARPSLHIKTRPRRAASSASGDFDLEASLTSPTTRRARLSRALGNLITPGASYTEEAETVWNADNDYAWDTRMLFKRKITTLYTSFMNLKVYVDVNYTGFRKILKKYDKTLDSHLKEGYMHDVVEYAAPFQASSRDQVRDALNRLVALYAKCVTLGDAAQAQKQLRVHQREQIVWERDTVWRQMIGKERRGESDGLVKAVDVDPLTDSPLGSLLAIPTPFGRLRITGKRVSLVVAVAIFTTLLNIRILEGVEANRCLALLVFATILWATEAIPLFVTSMVVPLLVVCLQVIRSADGARLSTPDATKYIFSVMFSPTIMLLIGGFTIASALSKTDIDRVLITRVLSLAGKQPSTVLLAIMGVACFASMWISNVAAPTLCFTLIKPILRALPPKSPFGPCLIIAIALAANIGGQSSPISSPQNLIALQYMDPPLDWLEWFAVAIPVSAISIVLIWLLLLVSYRPGKTADGNDLEIKPIRAAKESFTPKQYYVSFVCIFTIGLWCIEHSIEPWVGDMGIIAIIPIVAFFGTGVLKKADFDQFLWTVVFLAMGGIALGKAVVSSGLLEVMDVVIRNLVQGLGIYEVVLALSLVVVVVSTFISHTIASVLLVPIAKEVGNNLPDPHARLLIFITGLVCSTGMGMPVSGFPNQTAATQEDDIGQLYLSNVDFLKNGVPASFIATLVVATVGYVLMRAIGL